MWPNLFVLLINILAAIILEECDKYLGLKFSLSLIYIYIYIVHHLRTYSLCRYTISISLTILFNNSWQSPLMGRYTSY